MRRTTSYVNLIIIQCVLFTLLLIAGTAQAVTKVDHNPLRRIVGFPSFFKETGWIGARLGSAGLYVNFRYGIGGNLAQLDMYGSGYLNPLNNTMWFEGYSGTAEMGLGIDAKVEYKLEVTFSLFGRDYPISHEDVLGEFNYGFFDRKSITPYLLDSDVTLSDDVGPIPVFSKDFEFDFPLPWNKDYKLEAEAGVQLTIDADNIIAGKSLSTDKGSITSEGQRMNVVITKPSFRVSNISQKSTSAWTLGFTPGLVFSVDLGPCCEFELDFFTIPLSLPPLEFTTLPETITFCTGTYYHDGDRDGYGDPYDTTTACSQPASYRSIAGDCDDSVASVNPSAVEVAGNGIDDNCNGVTDETNRFYLDADGDSFGDPTSSTQSPTLPSGYVTNALDCDDSNSAVFPGANLIPGLDANCDGILDAELLTFYRDADGDGYGNPQETLQAAEQPTGYVLVGGDCNDGNNAINPGAREICDYFYDNDCDGEIDEGVKLTYYADFDRDGYGNPAISMETCKRTIIYNPSDPEPLPDPMDPEPLILASAVDPGPPNIRFRYALNSLDCDDTNALINPRAPEVCANSKDDNCNNQVDEVCHPPVATAQTVNTDEDTATVMLLSATDVDNDPLTFALVAGPTHGTVSGAAPGLTYTPHENYFGPDSLTFQANDGTYLSSAATVSITVNAVNDRPVANAGPDQTLTVGPTCEATATLNGSASYDIESDALTYAWNWMEQSAVGATPQITVEAGVYSVGLVVNDGIEDSLTDNMSITAVDQTPPVITTPSDIIAECVVPSGQQVYIGMATVTDNCCAGDVAASGPALFPLGESLVTWTSEDCNGNIGTATQTVTVSDTTPPALTLDVSPTILWPPNHKMVEVFPVSTASDVCCGADVTVQLLSVTMSEGDGEDTFDPLYDTDPVSGLIGDDIQIIDGRIYLRAERSGKSDGRTYTITYSTTDCNGNVSIASSAVEVPHDQR